MSLSGKKILVGVTGSIAAYKAAIFIRGLVKAGAEVQVILSPDAESFVSPLTFSTLSKRPCLSHYVNTDGSTWNNHVHHALWADAMVIYPTTMHTIAKISRGICDNLLMAIYFSTRCPVFIAPAMDEDMWKHPANKANVETIKGWQRHKVWEVQAGELASGLIGEGRLIEPEVAIGNLNDFFLSGHKLKGKKVVVTAGPTYESLDPVRFIGNHSSGKMGLAIAEALHSYGAEVHLIMGEGGVHTHTTFPTYYVGSALQMLAEAEKHFTDAEIFIFSAAVADYRPAKVATEKIKKTDDTFTITMVKNPDIASLFGKQKRKGQLSIGFALETEHEIEHAKAKMQKKNFDAIVLNSLKDKGAGFKHDTNKIKILEKNGHILDYDLKSKQEVAEDIVQYLIYSFT
jgi:phosphopantothenoylcysteine decarboxylase/phosphopantothenate--cysteine ligase